MTVKDRAGEAVPKSPFADLLARYQAGEIALNQAPDQDREALASRFDSLIDDLSGTELKAENLPEAIAALRHALHEHGEGSAAVERACLAAALGYFDGLPASSVDTVRLSKVADAMFDLEFDVLALMHMADMAANKFDQAAAVVGGDRAGLTFRITEYEHDQFTFLLNETAMRADRLLRRYRAAQKGEAIS